MDTTEAEEENVDPNKGKSKIEVEEIIELTDSKEEGNSGESKNVGKNILTQELNNNESINTL